MAEAMERIHAAASARRAAEKEGMVHLKEPRRRRNFVECRRAAPAYPAAILAFLLVGEGEAAELTMAEPPTKKCGIRG